MASGGAGGRGVGGPRVLRAGAEAREAAARASGEPAGGWTLRHFTLQEEVYRSSGGAVWRATVAATGQQVALKRRSAAELGKAADVTHEVKLLRSVAHEGVVRCLGAFWADSGATLWVVLEWAPGGDLYRLLSERRAARRYLPEEEIWEAFEQLARALAFLHSKGVVHRDIKTLNVLVWPTERARGGRSRRVVKLADLGVGRQMSAATQQLATFVGTPLYASPEVCDGQPYDAKTDIWSLGVVLYEMAALEPPFSGASMVALARNIYEGKYKPLPAHYSGGLNRLVRVMLNHVPRKRPSAEQLVGWLEERPVPAPRKPHSDGAAPPGAEPGERRRHGRSADERKGDAAPSSSSDARAPPPAQQKRAEEGEEEEPPGARHAEADDGAGAESKASAGGPVVVRVGRRHRDRGKAEAASEGKATNVRPMSRSERRRAEDELRRRRVHQKRLYAALSGWGEGEESRSAALRPSTAASEAFDWSAARDAGAASSWSGAASSSGAASVGGRSSGSAPRRSSAASTDTGAGDWEARLGALDDRVATPSERRALDQLSIVSARVEELEAQLATGTVPTSPTEGLAAEPRSPAARAVGVSPVTVHREQHDEARRPARGSGSGGGGDADSGGAVERATDAESGSFRPSTAQSSGSLRDARLEQRRREREARAKAAARGRVDSHAPGRSGAPSGRPPVARGGVAAHVDGSGVRGQRSRQAAQSGPPRGSSGGISDRLGSAGELSAYRQRAAAAREAEAGMRPGSSNRSRKYNVISGQWE